MDKHTFKPIILSTNPHIQGKVTLGGIPFRIDRSGMNFFTHVDNTRMVITDMDNPSLAIRLIRLSILEYVSRLMQGEEMDVTFDQLTSPDRRYRYFLVQWTPSSVTMYFEYSINYGHLMAITAIDKIEWIYKQIKLEEQRRAFTNTSN